MGVFWDAQKVAVSFLVISPPTPPNTMAPSSKNTHAHIRLDDLWCALMGLQRLMDLGGDG